MEIIGCSPPKSLLSNEIKIIGKLSLNSATFIFIQQHAQICPNFQTSIYFKIRSFLNPYVFFHCIFSFHKGKDQWLKIGQEYCLSLDNYTGKS